MNIKFVVMVGVAAMVTSTWAESVSFDFQENRGCFEIVGSNGQRFETKWSSCDADSIYAYQDTVRLVGVGDALVSFPSSSQDFVSLDWEQRAPRVREGSYVVFLNAQDQFLCVRVKDVMVKSRGDAENRLTIDYRVYAADAVSAQTIIQTHDSRQADYMITGKDEGVGSFCYVNNSGKLTITGSEGQQFVTKWSARSADSVYAYRDYVGMVCDTQRWTDFPASAHDFPLLNWSERTSSVEEGTYVVFQNVSNQYLCVRVNEVLSKARGDAKDLMRFAYKIYRHANWIEDGSASFDHTFDYGRNMIYGTKGQQFLTEWSWADNDTVYSYRDYERLVAHGGTWSTMPESTTEFVALDWERREVTV